MKVHSVAYHELDILCFKPFILGENAADIEAHLSVEARDFVFPVYCMILCPCVIAFFRDREGFVFSCDIHHYCVIVLCRRGSECNAFRSWIGEFCVRHRAFVCLANVHAVLSLISVRI